MTFQTKGRLAALFLLTLVVGVVAFAILRNKPVAAPAPTVEDAPFASLPDSGKSVGGPGLGPQVQDLVSLVGQGVWTRVDPASGKLRFKMTWQRLDPLEAGVFEIEQPRAWMIGNGRTVEVAAAKGRIVWPSREQEPESGELTGEVVATARSGESAAGEGEIFGTMKTGAMEFNNALGELRSAGVVEIEASGVRGSVSGLTVRLGRDGARPLNMLKVERGGRLVFVKEDASRTGSEARATGEARPGVEERSPGGIEMYQAVVREGVTLSSGARSLAGATLTVWARLLNGSLGEGAIASFESEGSAAKVSGAGGSTPKSESAPEPVELSWAGELEVKPLRDEPRELARDEVFARVEGAVVATDGAGGAELLAGGLEYGATQRAVAAYSDVRLSLKDVGEVRTGRIEVDLTTGAGLMTGPGGMTFAQGGEARERGAAWKDAASFVLDVSGGPVGVMEKISAREVSLAGEAALHDGAARARGDSVRAWFTPGGAAAPAAISRVSVQGQAEANDARGGSVTADAIDVEFAPDEKGEATPTVAVARGSAKAEREGESLSAGLIEATLRRSGGGAVELATLDAREDARAMLVRGEGDGAQTITANASRIRADTGLNEVELTGAEGVPVTVMTMGSGGTGEMSGPSMRLATKEGAETLTVFGAGRASYRTNEEDGAAQARIETTWQGSLIYDDAKGRAEMEGGATAGLDVGLDEHHRAEGDRIVVEIGAKETPSVAKRELVRAVIEGGEKDAEVELRRHAPATAGAGGERVLKGLAFLRGPRIELDARASKLNVEGKGLLLLEDRGAPEASSAGDAPQVAGLRGTSMFTWDGGMTMDRGAGEGEMMRNVRLRHKDPSSGDMTDVWCQRLAVKFRETTAAGAGDGSAPDGMMLERAEASDSVTAAYKALRLTCDRLVYEDSARKIVASAGADDRRATLFDEEKGQTFSAAAFEIEMATGTYRAVRADTVVAPR